MPFKHLETYFSGDLRELRHQYFANEYKGLWRVSPRQKLAHIKFIETKFPGNKIRTMEVIECCMFRDVIGIRKKQCVYDINVILIFSHNHIILAEFSPISNFLNEIDDYALMEPYLSSIFHQIKMEIMPEK